MRIACVYYFCNKCKTIVSASAARPRRLWCSCYYCWSIRIENMNSITARNWDLLDCVNAKRARLLNYFNSTRTRRIGKTRLTSWLQAQVCQIFLRTKALTYLIYHRKGVPVYEGNLIREEKMCPCVPVCVCVCATTMLSAFGKFSGNARKVTEQKCRRLVGQPAIYSRNQKNARITPDYSPSFFFLDKNTCHLSDAARARPRTREIFKSF